MLPKQSEQSGLAVSRRGLLKGAAAAAVGLVIGISFTDTGRAATAGSVLNAFVTVNGDGSVDLTMPSVEMGQGIYTSMAMILAEELNVSLDSVRTVHAPPDQDKYGNPFLVIQATGGSTSIRGWYEPLRKAGAAARAMIVAAAAASWGVDPAGLTTEDGVVHEAGSGRTLRYGDLVGTVMRPSSNVPLKDPKEFKVIGKPVRRLDTPGKADGSARFGIDVMLPGMKFAMLAACPVFGGRVGTVDDRKALQVPGVTQIVVLEDLVAVVATNTWAAKLGLDTLDVIWEEGGNARLSQQELWQDIRRASEGPAVKAEEVGDPASTFATGEIVDAVYELPFLAHTAMEPMNCTVHVVNGGCEIWVGTQVPGKAQGEAAKALGLDPAAVKVNNHLLGGGFGRRLEADGVAKAVRIAAKVDGPVKVTWSREEDVQQDFYRPMYHNRLRARIENGSITGWEHRVTGPSILARWLPPAFKNGIDIDAVDGAVEQPYGFPNRLVEYVRHEPPIPVGFWRGVGPNSNVFSAECFVDLVAQKLKRDPVEFRKSMLGGSPRCLQVLDLATTKAGWGAPARGATAGSRSGRGVAAMSAFGSFLSCVADVVVEDDGSVRVTRVVVAADVGVKINPDTLAAQIEGGVIFGVGTILFGQVTIDRGRVEQGNFNDYRLLRIDEAPVIEVHLVDSDEKPGGIGEPGTVVVQPAVSNAIFAATGIQLARMPVDRSKLARRQS